MGSHVDVWSSHGRRWHSPSPRPTVVSTVEQNSRSTDRVVVLVGRHEITISWVQSRFLVCATHFSSRRQNTFPSRMERNKSETSLPRAVAMSERSELSLPRKMAASPPLGIRCSLGRLPQHPLTSLFRHSGPAIPVSLLQTHLSPLPCPWCWRLGWALVQRLEKRVVTVLIHPLDCGAGPQRIHLKLFVVSPPRFCLRGFGRHGCLQSPLARRFRQAVLPVLGHLGPFCKIPPCHSTRREIYPRRTTGHRPENSLARRSHTGRRPKTPGPSESSSRDVAGIHRRSDATLPLLFLLASLVPQRQVSNGTGPIQDSHPTLALPPPAVVRVLHHRSAPVDGRRNRQHPAPPV